jgi:ABC-type Fe3+ transport system substrate-binding protein
MAVLTPAPIKRSVALASVLARALAAVLIGLLSPQALSQERRAPLIVLSSLPEVLARQQITAFERSQPGVRVDLLTVPAAQFAQRIRDRQAGGERVDVVISATPQALDGLVREGLLQVLDVSASQSGERTAARAASGAVEGLSDAGPALVTRVQLPLRFVLQFDSRPESGVATSAAWSWWALAEASMRGKLAVGAVQPPEAFALLAGVALQAQAWQPGWRWLAQFAGNAQPAGEANRAGSGAGLSLVLLPLGSSMSETALPVLTVTVPARLGVVAGSRDMRMAQRFTRFLTAQMLLERQEGLARAGGAGSLAHRHDYLNIDGGQLEGRHSVIASLVEQTLLTPQLQLRRVLERLDEAAARAQSRGDRELVRSVDAVRERVLRPLLAESDLKLAPVLEAFGEGLTDTVRRARIEALEAQWRESARSRIAEAERETAELIARAR